MTEVFRNYNNDERFGSDYYAVCDFLIRINQEKIIYPNFLWARWTWMISRPVDDEDQRNLIGLWKDNGKIVALATFELDFGEVFIIIDPDYHFLLSDIISYSEEYLSSDNKLNIFIPDNDRKSQRLALKRGYIPTQYREPIAVLDIYQDLDYILPNNYRIISMADEWDFYKYNRVMWRGFDHDGEPDDKKEDIDFRKTMLSSPHIIPELIIAVQSPDGHYASHCGLWYKEGTDYAYVEPVVTDPDHRKRGLGKACVMEAVKRAGKMGAKEAIVCSSQQFYYNMGFYPIASDTMWSRSCIDKV